MTGISIIVCCYNSEKKIKATLEHIALQRVDFELQVEVILVNNKSTDDTVKLAAKEWDKLNSDFRFKIVDEINPGLSAAREKGVISAKYEFIVFCDDDNWLSENYIQIAFGIMMNDALIGALGGQSVGISDVTFPNWWHTFKNGYAVGTQRSNTGVLTDRTYIWGAGMVLRRSLLLKVLDKRTPLILTDRNGISTSSGGDAEICNRVLLLGYKLYYDERLIFTHYISGERLTVPYRIRLYESFKYSTEIIEKYAVVRESLSLTFRSKIAYSIKAVIKLCLFKLGIQNSNDKFIFARLLTMWHLPGLISDTHIRNILKFIKYNN